MINNNLSNLPSPEEYLSRTLTGSNPPFIFPPDTLFYPGAGCDIDPAIRFVRSANISTVVYVDYLWANYIEETFDRFGNRRHWNGERIYEIYRRNIVASDLGCSSAFDLYPDNWFKKTEKPPEIIGTLAIFEQASFDYKHSFEHRRSPRTIRFIYLTTEAIQTYLHIWGLPKKAPLAVVVQNHCKGGLWTRLDGDCLLYACSPVLPRFLYVGNIGSEPWPNYKQVSCEVIDSNSMHRSTRSLYECIEPNFCNTDSPFNLWDGQSPLKKSEKYAELERMKISF
jgi:hypothetical protein